MPEITQEELDLLNKYKGLGEPEAIESQLAEGQTLARKVSATEASFACGYKLSVLEKLTEGLDLQIKDDHAFIGDVPIEDYANENWQDFLPALRSEDGKKKVAFIPQNRATEKAASPFGKSFASDYIKRTYVTAKEAGA
jgi:hypothetical protein